jgi:hypothetical protein
MTLRLLLAGFGLILMVAACAPDPELRNDDYLSDDSFLTGDPCGAPCWRGITPGETTWQDARTIIEDDPTLEDFQTQSDDETDRIGAAWSPVDGELCCQMFSSENGEIVEFMILQTAPEEEFSSVSEIHGDPQYLSGEILTEGQGLVSLFYENIPMLIYVFVAGESGEITESSEVIGFAYMTETLMQELLETSTLQAWDGPGTYREYFEGEPEITPIPTEEVEDES